MLLFLDFPEETRKLLGPGTLAEGVLTGTHSTRPSSTTLEILTPDRDTESSDDGLTPPTALPLLLGVLQHPPPIKSLTHTPTDVSHHLRTRRSLHVAPWLEDSAVRDPVRHGSRFSQHGNPRV